MNLDIPENEAQTIISTEKTGSEVERSIPDTSVVEPVIPDQEKTTEAITQIDTPTSTEPKPSYVKLAMRNMVKKRGLSLQHFFLTTIGLLAFLVGLAYLTR